MAKPRDACIQFFNGSAHALQVISHSGLLLVLFYGHETPRSKNAVSSAKTARKLHFRPFMRLRVQFMHLK
jgi:hypothetical protein